ncbi:MAG TPA: hypothetical protein ENH03_03860 [Candidatus Bathyarchaeota archaeon]|nr:hypothetical protein [Candidatus Bathyarchaeota archaeon]
MDIFAPKGAERTLFSTLLSEVFPPKYRGGAIGMYQTLMDLGGFTGSILFMITCDWLGFTSHLL